MSPERAEAGSVRGFDHVALPMQHTEAMITFYRSLGVKVADWTINHMQDRDGHFYYRVLDWTKVKTPLMHWGQGTMFKALANLLKVIEVRNARATAATAPVAVVR